ncbi:ATP-dependent RNA helicase [Acrasis kona]|uniref:RNA helicase n=1 Tax=Acrasis kona TaxID=1008807 RepID=A0AAW2ZIX8_9EUKA
MVKQFKSLSQTNKTPTSITTTNREDGTVISEQKKVEDEDKEMRHILDQNISDWNDFGFDKRLISAIYKLGFQKPTRIQQNCIPVAMAGRDVLGRSITGSGKTAAYILPVIQAALMEKAEGVKVIIIVPTKELCIQVQVQIKELTQYCSNNVKCLAVTNDLDRSIRSIKFAENPDILVGTANHLVSALEQESDYANKLKSTLKTLVVDEGDLVLKNQNKQMHKLVDHYLPTVFQCLMMSATLDLADSSQADPKVESLYNILLKNPIKINVQGESSSEGRVVQYYFDCWQFRSGESEDRYIDKVVSLYYLIAYKFKGGRVIIFVNGDQLSKGFLVQMILKNIGITDSVFLSDDYPLASRIDIIDQFNKGKYTALISSDAGIEGKIKDRKLTKKSFGSRDYKEQKNMRDRIADLDKDTSLVDMSRGIDFKRVAAVINFDVPSSVETYTHRVGRTARAGQIGVAITLLTGCVDPTQKSTKIQKRSAHWDNIFMDQLKRTEKPIEPYPNVLESDLEAARYRIEGIYDQIHEKVLNTYKQSIKTQFKNAELLKAKKFASSSSANVVDHRNIAGTELEYEDAPEYLDVHSNKDVTLEKNTSLLDDRGRTSKELASSDRKRKRKAMDPLYHFDRYERSEKNKRRKVSAAQKEIFSLRDQFKDDRGVDVDTNSKKLEKIIKDQKQKAVKAMKKLK